MTERKQQGNPGHSTERQGGGTERQDGPEQGGQKPGQRQGGQQGDRGMEGQPNRPGQSDRDLKEREMNESGDEEDFSLRRKDRDLDL